MVFICKPKNRLAKLVSDLKFKGVLYLKLLLNFHNMMLFKFKIKIYRMVRWTVNNYNKYIIVAKFITIITINTIFNIYTPLL